MYILHIETSTRICSVALSQNGTWISGEDLPEEMNQSAVLASQIQKILTMASVTPKSLSAISVSSGPGSYTGLRVGGATAKAMAYSLEIPLIAVPTLTALARAVFDRYPEAQYALPMLDARRNEVYTALYDRPLQYIWPVRSVILQERFFREDLPSEGQIYSGGDGSFKIGNLGGLAQNLTVDTALLCNARHLIPLSVEMLGAGLVEDPLHFVPFYMKPPNITQAKKEGLISP